ncbi:hypothetical protein Hypma_000472 [Hypsizygus marmoreus]|uniref:Uncharacterized protein n=1 Tax=Hypsizygus marmoreus TaxID=39966 RepID=A0A369J862_HYPMA|nr:hypothetical protein Hypma_000472 [Hypsizygus marmoreus]
MSSPPVIDKSALPSTPAQEWANQTADSLNQRSEEGHGTPVAPSGSSTPGLEFPGAYPGSESVTPSGKGTGVYETCKSYIPGQKDVENVVLSASETAKQYLPSAVGSYLPASKVPLPPDDKSVSVPRANPNGKEAIDTGREDNSSTRPPKNAVSGPENDSASEPRNPRNIDTAFLTPHTNVNSSDSNSISNVSIQAQNGSERNMSSTPDTPTAGSYPAFLGPPSGDITDNGSASASGDTLHPGEPDTSSQSVPKTQQENLPSEAEHTTGVQQPVINTTARTHPLAGKGAQWKGVPLEEGYQAALDNNPDRQLNLGSGRNTTSATQTAGHKETMKEMVFGPTAEAPSKASRPNGPDANVYSTRADAGHSPIADKQSGIPASPSNQTHPTADEGPKDQKAVPAAKDENGGVSGSPHKSTFMEKIKGEVKVISGKLAHNEEKVEEGKRLMGKSV